MSNPDQGDPRSWTEQQLLLTAAEAARALHLGRSRLFALIKNGELHALHIGRSCRLTRAELLRYVARLDRRSAPTRPDRETFTRSGRTVANQGGILDLDPTPPDAA